VGKRCRDKVDKNMEYSVKVNLKGFLQNDEKFYKTKGEGGAYQFMIYT